MANEDCPFCAIIAGTASATIFYEDAGAVAFLDHAPYTRGHALIVPRAHYMDLLTMPALELGDFFHLAQRIGQAAMDGLNAGGFHLGMNTGKAARQVVFHAHIHIIPRWEGDQMDFSSRLQYQAGEEQAIRAALHEAMSSPG